MKRTWIDDAVYALLTVSALVVLPPLLVLFIPVAVMYVFASRGNPWDDAPSSCRRTRRGEGGDSSARNPP